VVVQVVVELEQVQFLEMVQVLPAHQTRVIQVVTLLVRLLMAQVVAVAQVVLVLVVQQRLVDPVGLA
jgi:hypothetical protein